MEIRRANLNDLDSIMEVIASAKKVLAKQKSGQWQGSNGYPGKEDFIEDIENKRLYVLDDAKIIGVYALISYDPNYDELVSGKWEKKGKYYAIHRFAILDTYQNKGYGLQAFEHISKQALQDGIYMLRVDTHILNTPMLKLIEKAGFKFVGEARMQDGTLRNAYEKILVRGFIFDMDGTLLDSMEKGWYKYGKLVAEKFIDPSTDMSEVTNSRDFVYKVMNNMDPIDQDGFEDRWFSMMDKFYQTEAELKESVVEFLERARKEKIKMVIATATPRDMAIRALDRIGIGKYFEEVFDEDSVNDVKRNPTIYLAGADKLKLKPSECMVFEDNANFGLVAHNAEFKTCCVYDDLNKDKTDFMKSYCDCYIKSFKDIL